MKNTGDAAMSYRAPSCGDLLVVLDEETAGPPPGPGCGTGTQEVTLPPGGSRSVTVTFPAAPGPHQVEGVLTAFDGATPARTPPIRVLVT